MCPRPREVIEVHRLGGEQQRDAVHPLSQLDERRAHP